MGSRAKRHRAVHLEQGVVYRHAVASHRIHPASGVLSAAVPFKIFAVAAVGRRRRATRRGHRLLLGGIQVPQLFETGLNLKLSKISFCSTT